MSLGSISRPTYFDCEKINAKRNMFVSIPVSNQATRGAREEEVTAHLRQGSRSEPTTLQDLAAKGLNRTSSTVRTGDSTQGTMVGESGGTGRHPLLQSRRHTTEEDIPLHQVWTLAFNQFFFLFFSWYSLRVFKVVISVDPAPNSRPRCKHNHVHNTNNSGKTEGEKKLNRNSDTLPSFS